MESTQVTQKKAHIVNFVHGASGIQTTSPSQRQLKTLPSLSIPPQKFLFSPFHSFSLIPHDVTSTTNIDTTISRDLAQHLSATPKAGNSSRPASPVHYDFAQSKEPSPGSTLVRMPDSEAGTATDDTGTEATCSSDEFNWSDDEDAKSRRVAAEKKARCGRAVWLAFKKLVRPVRSVHITTTTPCFCFVVLTTTPSKPHVVPWSLWIGISWAVACALSLFVDLFPRFLLWIIFVIYGKAPETFKTQLELFMAVSFWLKLVLDVSGMWVPLSLIRKILHPPGHCWTVINHATRAVFAAAISLLAEKVFNRITLKVLDKLSNAIPQFPIATKKKEKDRHSPGNSLEAGTMLGAGATFSAQASLFQFRSALPDLKFEGGADKKEKRARRRPGWNDQGQEEEEQAVADVLVDQLVDLKDVISQVALKDFKFGKEGEIGTHSIAGLEQELTREHVARFIHSKLFSTLSDVYSPRSHLIVGDFYPYFRVAADAKVAFAQFDKNNNGDISKNEMREAVQRISRERKALSASLKDMSSAVSKLDAVMIGVALIIILFVCLLIFNPGDNISSLIPLATIVLGFSFVFGNSAKTIFESVSAASQF
ncbi:hypothetical protein FRC04_008571 [Tulasnella sp. 424]|nr:hypothetical protein FRC04_008571 [Tulasnella sp. 424]